MNSEMTEPMQDQAAEHDAHDHPTVAFYIWIGVILAILTGIEVAIYYIEALAAVKAPLLVVLSAGKLVLVVMFFMHLKMDSKALTWLFMAGVVLATFMISALIVLYHFLPALGGG